MPDNEIILSNQFAALPAKVQTALRDLQASPERYWDALVPIRADTPLSEDTPTLAQIQRGLGLDGAKLAVSIALLDLAEWFNVQRNLTDRQIAMTAEMICETHWDLTLNDLKGVFKHKMRTADLYGKLDGRDILGWLDEYKADVEANVAQIRDSEAHVNPPSDKPISYEEWSKSVSPKENYLQRLIGNPKQLTPEQQREKDLGFFKWKTEQYLTGKEKPLKSQSNG